MWNMSIHRWVIKCYKWWATYKPFDAHPGTMRADLLKFMVRSSWWPVVFLWIDFVSVQLIWLVQWLLLSIIDFYINCFFFHSHLHFNLPLRFASFAIQAQDYSFFEMVSLQVDRGGCDSGECILPQTYGLLMWVNKNHPQPSSTIVWRQIVAIMSDHGFVGFSEVYPQSLVTCWATWPWGLAKAGNDRKTIAMIGKS